MVERDGDGGGAGIGDFVEVHVDFFVGKADAANGGVDDAFVGLVGHEEVDGFGVEADFGERAFGSFRRAIQLGVPVNTRQAQAELSDGLLRIRFPKVPNRRGEEVPIEVRFK